MDSVVLCFEGRSLPVVRLFIEDEAFVLRSQMCSDVLVPLYRLGLCSFQTALRKAGAKEVKATPHQCVLVRDAGLVKARTNCVSLLSALGVYLAFERLNFTSEFLSAFKLSVVDAKRCVSSKSSLAFTHIPVCSLAGPIRTSSSSIARSCRVFPLSASYPSSRSRRTSLSLLFRTKRVNLHSQPSSSRRAQTRPSSAFSSKR